MHLVDTLKGDSAKEAAYTKTPAGMGLDNKTVEKVITVEVHGSSFADPGPDFCVYVAKDAEGREIARHRREGY